MLKLGVMVSGRGSNLQSIIDNIDTGELDAEIKIVISDNQEAYALERAEKWGIKNIFIDPGDFSGRVEYEKQLITKLDAEKVDIVVLAGFMRVLSPYIVEYFNQRIVNIHPSLLPSFPGLEAQKQALEYGVKISGCTVHFVDEGVDSGPIILQQAVEVKDDDTVDTLSARILKQEHIILPRALQLLADDRVVIKDRRVIKKG